MILIHNLYDNVYNCYDNIRYILIININNRVKEGYISDDNITLFYSEVCYDDDDDDDDDDVY